ncbi:methyltransferase domain-containing protein [Hydrogenovibrio sp. 3SP14C1]|uniref:methyltransferase domain-containing protein n=1 Tax=Hydrogenovibrio sp. 3SP14C1 TaxID=3038774 RepID=UPI002417AB3B|nr:methyltransferase domain-containing protein [Hydrogenovibrio sp. 3SP14C1]MDG4813538.1 methyltransferase domain-containing protein [Hydrogenovibrio sp. 3SP14C1]
MPKASHKTDRNFDTLIDQFEKRVYDTVKGEWRLKLLKEDLDTIRNTRKKRPGLVEKTTTDLSNILSIWDAGCGFAQISQWFAEAGHHVVACDLSKKMLQKAQRNFAEKQLEATFLHGSAQALAPSLPSFDLVLFHAVIEWLGDPQAGLATVAEKVKPGGYLSLLFYNRNAFVYTNVLKGRWRWQHILSNAFIGKGKKLTPPNPQYPEDMIQQLENLGFSIQKQTGIRVFHDYLIPEVVKHSDTQELLDLEYQYCRRPTYRDMGRYIHILARKAIS